MKKLAFFVGAVPALAFALPTPVAAQNTICYNAYDVNRASCEPGDTDCARIAEHLLQECLRTGVVVYI